MSGPAVSIVIPCYNSAEFIGDALQSALSQTYDDTEVIVVDDGSTDHSVEVLRDFGDRIRLVEEDHRGANHARNVGIEASTGEFVQFLDSDDMLLPDKLKLQMKLIAEGDADYAVCDWYLQIGLDESLDRRLKRVDHGGQDAVIAMLEKNVPIESPLHRRENLRSIGGFREELGCCQDSDLHLRLACSGLIPVCVPEPLLVQRIRRKSISSDYVKVLIQRPDVLRPAYDSLVEAGTMTDERAKAFACRMVRHARDLIRRGHARDAGEYFLVAKRMHSSGGLSEYQLPLRLLRLVIGSVLVERLVLARRRRARGK